MNASAVTCAFPIDAAAQVAHDAAQLARKHPDADHAALATAASGVVTDLHCFAELLAELIDVPGRAS